MSDVASDQAPLPYPPRRHLLRDLPFDVVDTGPDSARARLELVPEVFAAGRLEPGPVLVVTDVLAGLLVGHVIAPDWMATAQLALHLVDPPGDAGSPSDAVDAIAVDAVVRRAGRTTIVVEAGLSVLRDGELVGAAGSVGDAQLTFVRLPRRDGNLDIADTPVRDGERVSMALEDSGLRAPYSDAIGLVALDAGSVGSGSVGSGSVGSGSVGSGSVGADASTVELAVTPFVQNSFGAVNGGVVASMATAAAVRAAAAALDGPAVAADLTATYLAQGRVGPLRAAATVLRRTGPTVLCRVEVADVGQPDDDGRPRTVVVAHVHCLATA